MTHRAVTTGVRVFSAVALLVLLPSLLLAAGPSSPANDPRPAGSQLRRGKTPAPAGDRKVVSSLRTLAEDFRRERITAESAAGLAARERFSSSRIRVDDRARVQVYVTVSDVEPATQAALARHGLDIELVNRDFRVIQGWVPVAALDALAGEPAVLKIRPPSYGRPDAGSVTSEGDAVHRCDVARSQGTTGAGIKIGVISDGVDSLAISQGTADLPAVEVLNPGSGDEGTAMLEIVHDCAPGAALAFFGPGGSLDMINAVNSLIAAGAQVVVDDLVFLAEPQFEDGLIALNDRVAGERAVRVTSAGNRGDGHHRAFFTPGVGDAEVQGVRHNFGGGDTLLRVVMPAGTSPTIVMQWVNPFGRSGDDLDLCVRSFVTGALIACSADVQDGNDDPIEILDLGCSPSGDCATDLQVSLFAGAPALFDIRCYGGCAFAEFNDPTNAINPGQASVPEVVSSAASPAFDPTTIESFSNRGPATVFFPLVEVRNKPDVTGSDGVTTTVPGFIPFFGTSAASPHVGAVAGLVLSKTPSLTPAQVRTILRQTAVDLGPPGFDTTFGAGRVDAVAAIAAGPPPPPGPGPNPVATLTLNNGIFGTGQTVVGTADVVPGTLPVVSDAYVLLQLPSGGFLSLTPGGFVPGIVPFAAGFVPFAVSDIELLRYTFTGFEPGGFYRIIVGFTANGTLNVLGTADVRGIGFLP